MKKESLRYIQNARQILKNVAIEDNYYADKKPVREAFGAAYLAVLEAVNEALVKRGYGEKELPQSINGYRKAIKKHLAVHNGKLMKEFERLYEHLHIAGYYRGLITNTSMVKESMKAAEHFIKKVP